MVHRQFYDAYDRRGPEPSNLKNNRHRRSVTKTKAYDATVRASAFLFLFLIPILARGNSLASLPHPFDNPELMFLIFINANKTGDHSPIALQHPLRRAHPLLVRHPARHPTRDHRSVALSSCVRGEVLYGAVEQDHACRCCEGTLSRALPFLFSFFTLSQHSPFVLYVTDLA